MNKQEITSIFEEARASHKYFLIDGQVLLDGINLDRLEEPVKHEDCDLTHWCKSHVDEISTFPWFQELKVSHTNLHNKFSVLFYESMRKYNPKTFDQLLERFEALKSESETFYSKLDEIESEIMLMSEDEFNKTMSDHAQELDKSMQSIDIDKYEDDIKVNEAEQLDKVVYTTDDVDSAEGLGNSEKYDSNNNTDKKRTMTYESNNDEKDYIVPEIKSANLETIKTHISLKEQNINQLQQQKKLSELELAHLEETQKLTLQSAEQLENSFNLKQQEIELDHKDNDRLITFKNNTRTETLESLNDIAESTQLIREQMQDLEKQILEGQIKQESDKSSISIAKQFEELKHNKNKDLDRLKQHLQIRKLDLKQLQDQMLLLEEEISEMEMDVSKKKQDMTDLEEKEITKNEESALQIAEYERVQNEQEDSVKDKQVELDALLLKDQEKQKELEVIDFQISELNKSNVLLDKGNAETLTDIEKQKLEKQKTIAEIDKLKAAKQSEIDGIEKTISQAEDSLVEMKSTQVDEEELAVAE